MAHTIFLFLNHDTGRYRSTFCTRVPGTLVRMSDVGNTDLYSYMPSHEFLCTRVLNLVRRDTGSICAGPQGNQNNRVGCQPPNTSTAVTLGIRIWPYYSCTRSCASGW
jgi:hypothetical protein